METGFRFTEAVTRWLMDMAAPGRGASRKARRPGFCPLLARSPVRGVLVLLLAGLVLSGCSHSLTRVQTWDGEAVRDSEVAVLQAPSTVRVLSVNGREMSRFLVDDIAVEYQLLAGNTTVVFTYRTIWARPTGARAGEPRVDVVETSPQVLHFESRAGQVYRFELPEAGSRREAEDVAADFRASLVDAGGQRVADAEPWVGESAPAVAAGRPVVSRASVERIGRVESTAGSGGPGTVLEQLKGLWGEASEQERRDFLRWAFE